LVVAAADLQKIAIQRRAKVHRPRYQRVTALLFL
jgi:hypothetical protein